METKRSEQIVNTNAQKIVAKIYLPVKWLQKLPRQL